MLSFLHRTFFISLLAAFCLFQQQSLASGKSSCDGSQDLLLKNGKIYTGDPENPYVSSVAIRDGRFVAVGSEHHGKNRFSPGPCTKTINLKWKRVIPGLYDSHAHWVRAGLRPGHDLREIETAYSVAELSDLLAKSVDKLPAMEDPDNPKSDDFITAIGGWDMRQFVGGAPTKADLDAVAPDRPVYIHPAFFFPGLTNEAGKAFLESKGVTVSADGSVPGGPNAVAAFMALSATQSHENKLSGTQDLMKFSASVGLTSVIDHAGNGAGSSAFDTKRGYDTLLELARADKVITRVRVNFLSTDGEDLADLKGRIDHAWRDFGNGMVQVNGLGEELVDRVRPDIPAVYEDAVTEIAKAGWSHPQHAGTTEEIGAVLTAWENMISVNDDIDDIKDLRWSLEHVFEILDPQEDYLARVAALGAGVTVQNQPYLLSPFPLASGPPFRTIVDSGLPVGGGTDSTGVSPLNPWLSIYYMITGNNVAGMPINADQTITREEALHLYTLGSAWFSKEEDKLGSIEVGKYADLVVLDQDYFEVSDEGVRKLRSVMTVVDGRIVHSERPFKHRGKHKGKKHPFGH